MRAGHLVEDPCTEGAGARVRRGADRTRVKTAFLVSMSHEPRTLMNAIMTLTDLLLRDELERRERKCLDGRRRGRGGFEPPALVV